MLSRLDFLETTTELGELNLNNYDCEYHVKVQVDLKFIAEP